jgi:hypothetical protein
LSCSASHFATLGITRLDARIKSAHDGRGFTAEIRDERRHCATGHQRVMPGLDPGIPDRMAGRLSTTLNKKKRQLLLTLFCF